MTQNVPPPPTGPAPGTTPSGYPITVTYDLPDRIARWRPLVHWLLAIPHYVVSYLLAIVAEVVALIGWFAGVITGRVPEFVVQLIALNLRYSNRLLTYTLFLRETYPPFDFDLSGPDNGKDPSTRLDVVVQTENRSRLTIFFRALLVIPHLVVVAVLGFALYVVAFIGFFAVIILGRWPDGLRGFVLGFARWSARVNGYFFLATDEYPPFSLT